MTNDVKGGVMEVERRTVALTECEVRSADGGTERRHFSGYASVFNTPTMIGGQFREQVAPTAFDDYLGDGGTRTMTAELQQRAGQVVMLLNHDPNLILGRNGVNVTLSKDDNGLRVEADLPNTQLGRDTAELVDQRIIRSMSFGFATPKGGDAWAKGQDGIAERTLNSVRLLDVSPVVYPAYDTTTAEVRSAAAEIGDAPEPDGGIEEPVTGETLPAAEPEVPEVEAEEQNSAPAANETRVGKVLSQESADHVQSAIDHLQALMDSAGDTTDATDGEPVDDDSGDVSYNSANLAALERRIRFQKLA